MAALRRLLRSALSHLHEAAGLFVGIHDLRRLAEVHYLQAQAYHLLGPTQARRRDEASESFLWAQRKLAAGARPGWHCAVVSLSDMGGLEGMARAVEEGFAH